MRCEKCGAEIVQGANFCNNCGKPIITSNSNGASAYNMNTNQQPQTPVGNYQQGSYPAYPQIVEKKSKGKGCLIAILVVVGFFVIIGIFGSLVDNAENTNNNQPETTQKTNETETTVKTEIEKTLIYDEHNVKIHVKGIEDNVVKFYIENNSNLNYGIQAHSYAVNGIMTRNNPHDMGTRVPSKSKANTELEISRTFLNEFSIAEIRSIDINFWVSDNEETFTHFNTGKLTIKTNKYSNEITEITPDKNLFNKNGVSINYLYHNGNNYTFSLNNSNNELLTFFIQNITINDYAFNGNDLELSDEEVLNGCQYVFTIIIDEDFLDKNGIEEIKNINFSATIYNNADYRDDWSTGKISVDVE